MSRPRRNPSSTPTSMASISRDPLSSPAAQQALRFTVRLPASKLRQAIGESHPGLTVMVNSRDQFQGGEILDGKRSRNVKKSYIVESDSDEEDEEMEDVEEDADGDSIDDEDAIPEDDEDADADADGDVDMDIPPPRPQIKISRAVPSVISVKPSGKSDGKTVEQKEVSDDELSELDSEIEGEEGMQVSNEDDAEGEDEEIEVEDDEDSLDSDDDTPANGSRASTPDLTKLTKRQRARLEEGGSGHLLALPDEVQVKKHLTAEEHAMRRAEMARRRKNLSEKRNEEEKMETINKLLKKQAPKTNARRKEMNGLNEDGTEVSTGKPNPTFTRYISNKDGNIVAAPDEWLAGPVGSIFGSPGLRIGGGMVQEVE